MSTPSKPRNVVCLVQLSAFYENQTLTLKHKNDIHGAVQDRACNDLVEFYDHLPVVPLAKDDHSFYIECPESFVGELMGIDDHICHVRIIDENEKTFRYDGNPANTPSAVVRFFNKFRFA